ncbi:hypothetical protein ACFFK0_11150 [Paenibacillus chartarius]|uniref:Heparin-sulfate lyase N-terminal domain-containing protein n=1 Tax=Paenibacillus chartarius TaxID=747481 RepID=A0ABV6DK25_9BACL
MAGSGRNQDLLASLAAREESYDSEVKLQFGPMTSTYHTALKKETHPVVHGLFPSAAYALDLLDSGLPAYADRALQMLPVIAGLQDLRSDSPTYGVWPYFYEEPLDEMDSPDWNYADFIGKKLVLVLKRHHDHLHEELRQRLTEAVEAACRAIKKRDVGPGYTNIAAMGAFVTLVGGEVIGAEEFVEYGRNRLRRLLDYTMRLGTFVEFNSPCYTPITIEELHHVHTETNDPVSIDLSERLLHWAWKMTAEHYHPRTKQWAGPHSRSYSAMLRPGSFESRLLRNAAEEDAGLPLPRCPQELARYFHLEEERYFRQPIFLEEETGYQSYATTYIQQAYCLGSFSKDMMWNQRRNLIGYVDNGGKAAYVQLRVLKDGKDFSSAVFTGVQDRSEIVFGINMALDYGDWHPVLDPIHGVFEAEDLRIRIEIGGHTGGVELRAGPERELGFDAAAVIGEQTVRVTCLSAVSDLGVPRVALTLSEHDGTLGIDYVIYEGQRKRFNIHEWKQAAWVFLFTMSARTEELRAGGEHTTNEDVLNAWCEKRGRRMGISIPVKPGRIAELYRNNIVMLMDEEEVSP